MRNSDTGTRKNAKRFSSMLPRRGKRPSKSEARAATQRLAQLDRLERIQALRAELEELERKAHSSRANVSNRRVESD